MLMTSQMGGTGLSRGAPFPLWTEDEIKDDNDCEQRRDENDDDFQEDQDRVLGLHGCLFIQEEGLEAPPEASIPRIWVLGKEQDRST